MVGQSKHEAAKRLRTRLSNAHRAYMAALERSYEIGLMRGQQAERENCATYRRYMVALQQCTDFALSGTIPDDLL